MQSVTPVISGNEGIFALSIELNTVNSKIDMGVNVIPSVWATSRHLCVNSMENYLKIRGGTHKPRHKSVAIRILIYLFKTIKSKWKAFVDDILKSIRDLYCSQEIFMGGAINS